MKRRAGPRARGLRALAALGALGALAVALAWGATDRLEQRNDFCNACHLRPGVALHAELRRDFDAPRAASLAGAHAQSAVAARGAGPQAAFRCIDCHGGTGALGRLRVKALAGRDAFWYVVGRFEEPEGMRWPLWDEDCRKCHASFDAGSGEAWRTPRFHELGVHNADLGVGCVECHLVHETGGDPGADFLHATRVRSQCARCHSEFEEGAS